MQVGNAGIQSDSSQLTDWLAHATQQHDAVPASGLLDGLGTMHIVWDKIGAQAQHESLLCKPDHNKAPV